MTQIDNVLTGIGTYFPTLVVSGGTISSLPTTITDSRITTRHACMHLDLGTPEAQTGKWTVTNNTAGQATISGTISGSTAVTLYFNYTK